MLHELFIMSHLDCNMFHFIGLEDLVKVSGLSKRVKISMAAIVDIIEAEFCTFYVSAVKIHKLFRICLSFLDLTRWFSLLFALADIHGSRRLCSKYAADVHHPELGSLANQNKRIPAREPSANDQV